MASSKFGIIGLGVMGSNLSLNIASQGYPLSVYNRAVGLEADIVSDFLEENTNMGIQGFTDLEQFVNSIEIPRKILIMIKSGPPVDSVIEEILPFLDAGDVLIDGGNSHYMDTEGRIAYLSKKEIQFIGCGISGGEEGARKGPALMPGGPKSGYDAVEEILQSISAKDKNGMPCCSYIGKGGSGHYVKMIHNGIEYAEMQLLAEVYALLATQYSNQEIADHLENWNRGTLKSYLLEITIAILKAKDGENYVLDIVLDKSGNKGTGFWSVKSAMELGFPATMMSSALFARYISSAKSERIQLSKRVKGKLNSSPSPNIEKLRNAYEFARIINHHQGFKILSDADHSLQWELNLTEIARVWTNGCIIRSSLMEELSAHFKNHGEVLESNKIFDLASRYEKDCLEVVGQALSQRISTDCFSSAYNYWVAMTTERLPANLIQAQRDYFGGHTFQRTDTGDDEFYHFNWQ